MPLIQILTKENKLVTVGYDRVICHWEVTGIFLENLGFTTTLASSVT